MNNLCENPKSEVLNSRQIQINQAQNPKQSYDNHHREETLGSEHFEHLDLGFRYFLVFRILRLAFAQEGGDLNAAG